MPQLVFRRIGSSLHERRGLDSVFPPKDETDRKSFEDALIMSHRPPGAGQGETGCLRVGMSRYQQGQSNPRASQWAGSQGRSQKPWQPGKNGPNSGKSSTPNHP